MAKFMIALRCIILQSFLLIGIINAQNGRFANDDDCYTPNQALGICTPIRQCPPLLSLLTVRPVIQSNIDFLRSSQCGFASNNDPKVCCPLANQPGGESTQGPPGVTGNQLLPSDCGRDLSSRIVGGTITELDEFPWTVLLEYNKPNGKTTGCGGVLISERYVLTAAHCLKGRDLPRTWTLNAVRLGEYDTSSDRDCIEDGEDSRVCADDPVTIRIEEQIVHESYRPNSKNQENDVALLRLAQRVQFTNYIKPICLPLSSTLPRTLWVAGWGKTENRSESNIKLKLGLSPADRTACTNRYRGAGIRLSEAQLCAGGEKGKDSCRGDSGGPLMSVERNSQGQTKWTVVGVVSFGPSPCGMLGWPGIYTKIPDYVPWITSKLRD